MCRALKVLCLAEDAASLQALKQACVSVEWELSAGATNEADALVMIEADRPHVLVVFGAYGSMVSSVADRFPGLRIVVDRDTPGASAMAASLEEVRGLIKHLPRPGGPISG
jgi:hypothetical protein